jgi:hypothetical protein
VIDGRKIAMDVCMQDVAVTIAKTFIASERFMRAFVEPMGIAVMNETALEDRLDDVAECLMHRKRGLCRTWPLDYLICRGDLISASLR